MAQTTASTPDLAVKTKERRRTPYLFLVFEASHPMAAPLRISLAKVAEVTFGRGEKRLVRREEDDGRIVLLLADRHVSSQHAKLTRAGGIWYLQDLESRNGTTVNGERLSRGQKVSLADGAIIELARTFFIFRSAVEVTAADPSELDAARVRPVGAKLLSLLPELHRRYRSLTAIARSNAPVLLEGETGTGKEVVARTVHELSGRRGKFVAVNCGAVPAGLIESELFGFKKGAFSGASHDSVGLIRRAEGGTLLLDEIGDLPLPSQTALLRVLQEKEVTPLGGQDPIPVDLRVVAATHQDLDNLAREKKFRRDLLMRISGFRIDLPPLRERREDIGILIAAILRELFGEAADSTQFDAEATRALWRYAWPGNIRELERSLQVAVVSAGGKSIALEHLPLTLGEPQEDTRRRSEDLERREKLVVLLRRHRGNISAVARAYGRDRALVRRWLQRHGLDPSEFR